MYDFGHLLDLQLDSALVKCPGASDIVSAVNDVVRDLANSWYKAYAEECKVQDIRFLQPSALKRLKFVKHVEAQFTKFIKKVSSYSRGGPKTTCPTEASGQ